MGYYLAFINHTWNVSMQDPLLKELVSMANAGTGCDITLHTATGLVCGTMVSHREYFEHVSNGLANAWPGGPNEEVRGKLLGIGRELEITNEVSNSYIHLKNTLVVCEHEFIPKDCKGPYWRGKVESVIGFHLGAYIPESDPI